MRPCAAFPNSAFSDGSGCVTRAMIFGQNTNHWGDILIVETDNHYSLPRADKQPARYRILPRIEDRSSGNNITMNSQVVFQAEPGTQLKQKLEDATCQGQAGRNGALSSSRLNCSSSRDSSCSCFLFLLPP